MPTSTYRTSNTTTSLSNFLSSLPLQEEEEEEESRNGKRAIAWHGSFALLLIRSRRRARYNLQTQTERRTDGRTDGRKDGHVCPTDRPSQEEPTSRRKSECNACMHATSAPRKTHHVDGGMEVLRRGSEEKIGNT